MHALAPRSARSPALTAYGQQLVAANLGLAYSAVARHLKRHANLRVDVDALRSEALFALSYAAMYFNPDRGFAFSTYAVRCIHKALDEWMATQQKKRLSVAPLFLVESVRAAENRESDDLFDFVQRQLPPHIRDPLVDYYVHGLSVEEIGRRRGITPGSAAKLLDRKRRQARTFFCRVHPDLVALYTLKNPQGRTA